MRKIEMYYGRLDNTWDTSTIEIPDDTPEDKVAQVAEEVFTVELNRKNISAAFVGVYNDNVDEGE